MQPGEDVVGDQPGGKTATERSSQESPAEQGHEGEPVTEELAGSQAASGVGEALKSQSDGEEEEKRATEEAKKKERSQDALQDAVSPGTGDAELAASDGRDSQSEAVSSE